MPHREPKVHIWGSGDEFSSTIRTRESRHPIRRKDPGWMAGPCESWVVVQALRVTFCPHYSIASKRWASNSATAALGDLGSGEILSTRLFIEKNKRDFHATGNEQYE